MISFPLGESTWSSLFSLLQTHFVQGLAESVILPQVESMAIKCNLTTPSYSLLGATVSGRAETSLCNMTLVLCEYMYHRPGSTAQILPIESKEIIIICQLVSSTTPSTESRRKGLRQFHVISSKILDLIC